MTLGDPYAAPSWISLSFQFADRYTKIVDLKASGGVALPGDTYQTLNRGTCPEPLTSPYGAWFASPDSNTGMQLYCIMVFQITAETVHFAADATGSMTVSYRMVKTGDVKPGHEGCVSDVESVTLPLRALIKAKEQPKPSPAAALPPIPNVQVRLDWDGSTVVAPFGDTRMDYLHINAVSQDNPHWGSFFVVRNSLTIEPADEGRVVTIPEDWSAGTGIGYGAHPERILLSYNNDQLRFIFTPTAPKVYRVRFVLRYRVCRESNTSDCSPTKTFVTPMTLDGTVQFNKSLTRRPQRMPPKPIKPGG
jgi:hypothetical protein